MLPHGGVQGYSGEEGQYKLCVCYPSGLVFKVRKNYNPQKVSLMAYFITMKVAVPDDNHVRPVSSQVGCHSVVNTELDPCN